MFDAKAYKRDWMRNHRAKKHDQNIIDKGRCPITGLLLSSRYHDIDCPCHINESVELMRRETSLRIKHTMDGYIAVLVKDGVEIPFDTYFLLKVGGYFEVHFNNIHDNFDQNKNPL